MISKVNLFYLGGFLALAAVCVAEDTSKIYGLYTLETDPDNAEVKKYLDEMGFNEETQKVIRETKKVLFEYRKLNGTHYHILKMTKNKISDITFQSGVEFEAKLPDGRKVMNTITVDETSHTVVRVIKMEGFQAVRTATFSETGFNMTMKAKEAVAIISFSRSMDAYTLGDIPEIRNRYFGEQNKVMI